MNTVLSGLVSEIAHINLVRPRFLNSVCVFFLAYQSLICIVTLTRNNQVSQKLLWVTLSYWPLLLYSLSQGPMSICITKFLCFYSTRIYLVFLHIPQPCEPRMEKCFHLSFKTVQTSDSSGRVFFLIDMISNARSLLRILNHGSSLLRKRSDLRNNFYYLYFPFPSSMSDVLCLYVSWFLSEELLCHLPFDPTSLSISRLIPSFHLPLSECLMLSQKLTHCKVNISFLLNALP